MIASAREQEQVGEYTIPLCRYFVAGECTFGAICSFSHDADADDAHVDAERADEHQNGELLSAATKQPQPNGELLISETAEQRKEKLRLALRKKQDELTKKLDDLRSRVKLQQPSSKAVDVQNGNGAMQLIMGGA